MSNVYITTTKAMGRKEEENAELFVDLRFGCMLQPMAL